MALERTEIVYTIPGDHWSQFERRMALIDHCRDVAKHNRPCTLIIKVQKTPESRALTTVTIII